MFLFKLGWWKTTNKLVKWRDEWIWTKLDIQQRYYLSIWQSWNTLNICKFQALDHSMLCFVMVRSNFNIFFPCPLFGCIDCDPNNPWSDICVNNKGLLMPHVPLRRPATRFVGGKKGGVIWTAWQWVYWSGMLTLLKLDNIHSLQKTSDTNNKWRYMYL